MSYWVQECPKCHYVSNDIGEPTEFAEEIRSILKTDAYKKCGGISFRTRLGKRFYRHYTLLLAQNNTAEARSAILAATWCCDDDGDEDNAVKCRLLALELLPKSVLEEETENRSTLALVRADLLRRVKRFDEVIRDYTDIHFSGNEVLDSVAKYEVELSKNKDAACHTVREATERFPVSE